MSLKQQLYIGIDISKDSLDVYVQPLAVLKSFANTDLGTTAFLNFLSFYEDNHFVVERLVCEATGRLERPMVQALEAADYNICTVNPSQISGFRQACEQKAKTDNLDAKLIALFAERMPKQQRKLPPAHVQELQGMAVRRRQLVEAITAERNRLKRASLVLSVASIKRTIAFLIAERTALETAMETLIKQHDDLQQKLQTLLSIPGIGMVVAITLLSEMPELGTLNNQQAAALAGLAPMQKESGQFKGKATIKGGRKCVRTALYMAAMSAIRHNPRIKPFYDRKVNEGKHRMVALTASMRKLLLQANFLLKNNTNFVAP